MGPKLWFTNLLGRDQAGYRVLTLPVSWAKALGHWRLTPVVISMIITIIFMLALIAVTVNLIVTITTISRLSNDITLNHECSYYYKILLVL